MTETPNLRIPIDRLQHLANAVLKRDRFSGGDLSRCLDVNYQLLWAYFNRTGLPVELAAETARVLDKWAVDMRSMAREVRAEIARVDPAKAPARRRTRTAQEA